MLRSLLEDKQNYKVHDRSRAVGDLAAQLAIQWKAYSGIVTTGQATFNPHEMENQTKTDILTSLDGGVTQLLKDVEAISDEEWETGLAGWGGSTHEKKGT